MGQARVVNNVDQFSTEREIREAGMRPNLAPTDTIPMGIRTAWENPGEAILLREGEILPLTHFGPHDTDVFPEVRPAPVDIQTTDFEDRYPRTQNRGDMILRARSGQRGPAQFWKYGGMEGLGQYEDIKAHDDAGGRTIYSEVLGLGQPEGDPIMFNPRNGPQEVAYQTYPGPFLGQDDIPALRKAKMQSAASSLVAALAGGALIGSSFLFKGKELSAVLRLLGVVAGGIGVANMVRYYAEAKI